MKKRATAVLLCLAGSLHGAELTLDVRTIEAPSWRADGVAATLATPHDLQLRIAAVAMAGQPLLRDLRLRCRYRQAQDGAHCDDGRFAVTLPGGDRLSGSLQARYRDPRHWKARLDTPQLRAALGQDGATLTADVKATGLSFSEATGRYAAEKLSATARLRADGRRIELALDTQGGQAYAEPLFLDFSALPLHGSAALARAGHGWRIERLRANQGRAGTLELTGLLDGALRPVSLDGRLEAADLAPLVATDVLPFLIGTPLDGLAASGPAEATFAVRAGAPHRVAARLGGVTAGVAKLGVQLDGVAGELHWAAAEGATPPGSRLQWRGGSIRRVALGESRIAFHVHGDDFVLSAPWRQPLLGGALDVARLALRDLGGAQPEAEFDGSLEPVELAALCRALGWPEFGGTLGGRLPGLTVRGDTWSLDGALEAQVFDGTLRLGQLRAIQPLGPLPRVMADVQARRLDLERVTRAFSFGLITGRLDGDVTGLRLLDWRPVAFDARLYSTPGYGGSRRISQRAIDGISRIAGGPTGLVSRGFFRLFRDFAYDKLGITCVLRDGVCEMGGVEPAPSADGSAAYYLVRGRLLPRIDVVGHAQRVSWDTLIAQLQAAQSSGGAELEQ